MNKNEKKIWEEIKDRYNTCKTLSRVLDENLNVLANRIMTLEMEGRKK